jgi:DNA-binding IscR family transcriptional regulator
MSVFTSAVLQGLNAVSDLESNRIEHEVLIDFVPCWEISHRTGSTNLVMQRTLNKLSRAGIITVKRGPGGGFRITEEQLRTKRVLDVLEALGQPCVAPDGSRASDRIQQRFHDACDVTLAEFFS